jgi:Kef-type K+ transport system membrane component KefB
MSLPRIVVTCRATGALFRRFEQPPVIGEVVAGILLGPSLLGRVWPGAAAYLLPADLAPFLGLVSQLGVILYMFMVGLELDAAALLRRGHAALAISHGSIIVPFLLGAGLALGLYPGFSGGGVPFTVFALFLGVAMSVTAFPVLARILTDRGMSRSPLGVLALTCAAVDDVTAWCLLALVVGVARAEVGQAVAVAAGAAGYTAFMLLAARPLLLRPSRFDQRDDLSPGTTPLVLAALLFSAWATEFLGVHAVFGAFLLGAVIPHESAVARQLVRKMQDVVSILLLPAIFAYTGMRTQVALVSGPGQWLLCGAVFLVATLGKFGGSLTAARLAGSGWREAAALGVMMNTRGLMELIVLNIGLDLKVISPTLFAMMVLVELATTIATTPVLQLLTRAPSRGPVARAGLVSSPSPG